jgi:hypothetical protein
MSWYADGVIEEAKFGNSAALLYRLRGTATIEFTVFGKLLIWET